MGDGTGVKITLVGHSTGAVYIAHLLKKAAEIRHQGFDFNIVFLAPCARSNVAAGAMSIFADNPFERRFRDIHTLCQQIQGHAAHFESVGQVLMGLEPSRPLFTF